MCDCKIRRRSFLGMAAAVLALPGCGSSNGPASVRWGKENCDYCGMIIDDPRFAAQVRGGPSNKVWKFDDLGDGVLWLANQPWADEPKTEFWVGDSDKGTWLDGRAAFYLEGRKSPMAHNIGAVPDKRPGAMTFEEMRKLVLARGSTSRCEERS